MTNTNWQFKTEQSLVENHGLKTDEFEKIVEGLGREPNLTELGNVLEDMVAYSSLSDSDAVIVTSATSIA